MSCRRPMVNEPDVYLHLVRFASEARGERAAHVPEIDDPLISRRMRFLRATGKESSALGIRTVIDK